MKQKAPISGIYDWQPVFEEGIPDLNLVDSLTRDLKGKLALAIEEELGTTYSLSTWATQKIPGVCPITYAIIRNLYNSSPEWLRDELLVYAEKLSSSEAAGDEILEKRFKAIIDYTIRESFRLDAFKAVQNELSGLCAKAQFDRSKLKEEAYRVVNLVGVPGKTLPFLQVLLHSDLPIEEINGNSVYQAAYLFEMVSLEAPNREIFFQAWQRALDLVDFLLSTKE
jgi:hypothetical protein